MKLKRYLLLVMLIFSVSGCASKSPLEPKVTGEAFVSIASFFQSYINVFNSRDMNMLMSHYSPNSQTHVFSNGEDYILGRTELLQALEFKKDTWNQKNLRLVDFEVLETEVSEGLVETEIEFEVDSNAWIGKYKVTFALERVGNGFQILEENI